MFEIEKKFKITKGLEDRLLEHGAKYIKKVNFTDTYYDSEDFVLTLNDYWLRWRERCNHNQQWELKVPLCVKGDQGPVKVDKYKEISDEVEIVEHLSLHPQVKSNVVEKLRTVNEAIEALGITPFAKFATSREKFQVAGGFTIDLDKANFGYELGEIEVICQSKDEIKEATEKILDLAQKLGVTLQDMVTGKVGTYLKRSKKEHYDLLVAAGVLVSET